MELDFDLTTQDVTLVRKELTIQILSRHGIQCTVNDTVVVLRPILQLLKDVLKECLENSELKNLTKQVLQNQVILTEDQAVNFSKLHALQLIVQERLGAYYLPPREIPKFNVGGQLNSYQNCRSLPSFDSRGNVSHNYEAVDYKDNQVQAAMATQNLPLIPAGSFSGLPSENPNDFLDKYNVAALSNNWTEETKTKLFAAHLAGVALSWFNHYKRKQGNQQLVWNTLKSDFVSAFTPLAQAQNLQAVLDNRVQGVHETSMMYFLDVLTICRRYNPNIPDEQVVNHIIQGLRPEILDRIISMENNTLDALEANLIIAEKQVHAQNVNKQKYARVNSTVQPQSHSNFYLENPDYNSMQTEIRTLTNLVANLMNERCAERQNVRTQHRSPQPRSRDISEDRNRTTGSDRPSRSRESRVQFSNNRNGDRSFSKDRRESRSDSRSLSRGRQYDGYAKFCHICKRNNHNTRDCRDRNSQSQGISRNQKLFCRYCKRTNHTIDQCYTLKRNNKRVQFPKNA